MVGYQMHSHLFSTGIDREKLYCGEIGKLLFSPRVNRSSAQHRSSLRRATGHCLGEFGGKIMTVTNTPRE